MEACEYHLDNTASSGSEIESYLTQHILVILCAEMQQEIYNFVEFMAKSISDNKVQSFINSSSRRVLRSVKKEEIASFMGLFGKDIKDRFNSQIEEKIVTDYNNAVINRHNVAHKQGAQVSLNDLKKAIAAALSILKAAHFAFDLKP